MRLKRGSNACVQYADTKNDPFSSPHANQIRAQAQAIAKERSKANVARRARDMLDTIKGEFLVCHHTPTYQCSLT